MDKTKLNSDRKYLLISSKGEIEEDSFLIMGGSTKRNKDGKIGRFGSGLKYSIASLLGFGNNFKVYSGVTPIKFSTQEREFRGETFRIIIINGQPTNYSTNMGPDWDYYSAIRDIYANAVDEDLLEFRTVEAPSPVKDETHFYIEITEEIKELLDNFELYFSDFREDILLEVKGRKVFNSPGYLIVYKSGFKIHEDKNKESLFNYDFPDVSINESRLIKSMYSFQWDVAKFLLKYANDEVTGRILKESKNKDSNVFEFDIDWDVYTSDLSEAWEVKFKNEKIVTKEASSFYEEHKDIPKEDSFTSSVPRSLGKNFSSFTGVAGISSSNKPDDYVEISNMTSSDYQRILDAKILIQKLDLDENIEIKKAKFFKSSTKASVYKNSGKIYVVISEDEWDDVERFKTSFLQVAITEKIKDDGYKELSYSLLKDCLSYVLKYIK